jgi:hypothetical protein
VCEPWWWAATAVRRGNVCGVRSRALYVNRSERAERARRLVVAIQRIGAAIPFSW